MTRAFTIAFASSFLAFSISVSADLVVDDGEVFTGSGTINENVINHGSIIGGEFGTSEGPLVISAPWVVSGEGSFENTIIMGTFAPGNSPAISNGSNQGFGGIVQFELGGTTPGFGADNHDQTNSSASIFVFPSATLQIDPFNGYCPTVGDEFEIMTWQTGLWSDVAMTTSGEFQNVVVNSFYTDKGITFDTVYTGLAGVGSLTLVATAVPEASAFLAVGLLGVCWGAWNARPVFNLLLMSRMKNGRAA